MTAATARQTKALAEPFKFLPFSKKQKKLLTWWMPQSPYADYDMIIADGSIRSGKTVSMIDSFIMWSLYTFKNEAFIIAGKSMGALKRNVLRPLFQILAAKGIPYKYNRSEHYVTIGTNTYYCFGANNEASQDVLQGLTAAGALADEVALFPQSFIEQMIGRCSVDGSKLFFNCNPEGPFHYVKKELIDKADEKRILHLHFTLDDNPSLAKGTKDRYRRMYTGLWYRRYIQGLWTAAEGAVYDMFDMDIHVVKKLPKMRKHWISIDYGTVNPTVFLQIGLGVDHCLYVIKEYRWDSKEEGRQKTDVEYSKDLKEFIEGVPDIEWIFFDPSAASFGLQTWKDGIKKMAPADNALLDGIRATGSLLHYNRLRFHESCKGLIEEMTNYSWDTKAQERGEDKPIKQFDHGPDALRYAINGTRSIWMDWIEIIQQAA